MSHYLAARCDRGWPQNCVAADKLHLIQHIADHANMVRNDTQTVTDLEVNCIRCKHAMFFGQPCDFDIGRPST